MSLILALLLLIPHFLPAQINDTAFLNFRREQRRMNVRHVKSEVALFDQGKSVPRISGNGDDQLYSDKRGSYGKALLHETSGFINPLAFTSLMKPLQTENSNEFDQIVLGEGRKLVNPQASLAYSLSGNDAWINAIATDPTFAGTETAGEMVELYWTAMLRDVPFNNFTALTVGAAVDDLNNLSNFKGPKIGGVVTPGTFLRGNAPGELEGPYISQFLFKQIPFGSGVINQEYTVPEPASISPGNDFITTFADWFTVINGGSTGQTIQFDADQHFIRTPRDLGEYAHIDVPGQSGYCAALLLLSFGPDALDPNTPYLNNPTQVGFVTFGMADVLALVQEAAEEALKAAWFYKWQVSLRLRPEEYGFYLQRQLVEMQNLGINPELLNSQAVIEIFNAFGSYFLPQSYPEGSPTHPAYPSGHAAFSGAAITVLKAIFNEDFVIPDPLQPNVDNTALEPYPGILTVGGELNKLASNISLGRD
ncbi:MAG: hypothetical protein WD595_06015, partial [Waddliaceae bacterium]